jgi:hypothetical protein
MKEARNLHNHPSLLIIRGRRSASRLGHEVESKLTGKLDESIVSCFGDDENVGDVGADSRPTYGMKPSKQESHSAKNTYVAFHTCPSSEARARKLLLTELFTHLPHADGRLRELSRQALLLIVIARQRAVLLVQPILFLLVPIEPSLDASRR